MPPTGDAPEKELPRSQEAAAGTRWVLLVAGHTPAWADAVSAASAEGFECEWAPREATPGDVVALLARRKQVLVIDLAPDPVRSMTILTTARQELPAVPVIVVAHDPSIELARRIRLSGVFYMALDPVSPEEMKSVLANAFGCLGRNRTDTSSCRTTRRVLIVDDDVDFIWSIATLLESQGYRVSTARNAREGLEKVLADPPDLIVLDVMMEHDSAGYQVNQSLKFGPEFESVRHVPILMVSSIPVDPASRFRMAGEVDMVTPNAYLTKPVDLPRFLEEVRALLGEPSEVTST